MEYYTLSRYAYLRYYILILYYRLGEYPPVVRVWAIFGTVCLLLVVALLLGNLIRAAHYSNDRHIIQRNREKYMPGMREVALTERPLEIGEITAILELPKNFKMKERQNRLFVPVLLELRHELGDRVNKVNWQRMLQALKMPVYFETQVRSRNTRKRVIAFKNVADLDANLKEAVASRYLFTRDPKLKICARLHQARFGTSYPFKVLEEDPNLVFTDELMVKYHNVLVYRAKNNLAMPNFIRWCNRVPVNEELRIFAVNEIRLFNHREDCAELLAMLCNSRDERFSCALIRALGEMEYVPAEKEFLHRYLGASFVERQALAEALGAIGSGNPEVLRFLEEDFMNTTDYVSRMQLLRVIHDYGAKGKAVFDKLKATTPKEYSIYFDHIECDLIDSRRYA